MSDQSEQPNDPNSNRKRIIHWNPDVAHGSARGGAAGTRVINVKQILGIIVVLFALWFFWRVWIVVIEPTITAKATQAVEAAQPAEETYRFVSRSRVEQARGEALQSITNARNMASDHTALLRGLVEIENLFDDGERWLNSGEYGAALDNFERVLNEVAEFRMLVDTKDQSYEQYDAFVERIESLEEHRARAPFDYERALAKGNQGRSNMEAGDFAAALISFNEALDLLGGIQKRLDDLFLDTEIAAKRAMSEGDGQAARQYYTQLLELKPDYQPAIDGLARAATIEEVIDYLEQAEIYEDEGDLDLALEYYQLAFDTDPKSARAQQGLTRVKSQVETLKYDRLIADAEAAEEANNWDLAMDRYDEALQVFPDRIELEDKLANAREMKWKMTIEDALNRAFVHEEDRDWRGARNAYLEVLEMEKDHPEAVEGLLRAGKMIRAILRYEKFVESAANYAERGDFQMAIDEFNAAMGEKPSYLKLDPEAQKLKDLLTFQSEPVRVRFESDGRTWVSVSGFKLLGKFDEQAVPILPGNYEIRGRRKGYRDVVLSIQVRNGVPMQPIVVVCTDRI